MSCTGAGCVASKTWTWKTGSWKSQPYRAGKWFKAQEFAASGIRELAELLEAVHRAPKAFVVRGGLTADARSALSQGEAVRRLKHDDGADPASLEEAPRSWLMIDIDKWPLPAGADLIESPEDVIEAAIYALLPGAFHDVECWWQLSASAGFATDVLKAHIFFWLSEPASNQHIKDVLKNLGVAVDYALFNAAQPHYIAAPIVIGGHDPLPRRTGWVKGSESSVILPALKPKAARSYAGTSSSNLPADVEGCLVLLGDGDGLEGFHIPLRSATWQYAIESDLTGERDDELFKILLCNRVLSAPRDESTRPDVETYASDQYLSGLIDGAFKRISRDGQSKVEAPLPAHFPRPTMEGAKAAKWLRRIVKAFFNQVENILNARDERNRLVSLRLSSMTAADWDLEQEKAANKVARWMFWLVLLAPDLTERHILDGLQEYTEERVKRRVTYRATQAAKSKFGVRTINRMPRIQIKGVAGLGKSSAIIDEYQKRPGLWGRNIWMFVPTIGLAEEFAAKVGTKASAASPDGSLVPRAIVFYGRTHGREIGKALCHPDRVGVVVAAQNLVPSVYKAFCAQDVPFIGKKHCPKFGWCQASGYIAQFKDTAGALRLFPHALLTTKQADDLALPQPDLIIIDENCVEALVGKCEVNPAWLTQPSSYRAGSAAEIAEALAVGEIVAEALAGGGADITALGSRLKRAELLAAAKAADRVISPAISPSSTTAEIEAVLSTYSPGNGQHVARLLRQLAKDMKNGRFDSLAVEYCQSFQSKTEGGTRVNVPMVLVHQSKKHKVKPSVALCLIDADADLDINRQFFGQRLRGFEISAVRHGQFVQISNSVLATSSLAPPDNLPNNARSAALLRGRVGEFVGGLVKEGRKVLVVAAKPVRQALSGEVGPKLPLYAPWQGAELTSYGQFLGVDRWSGFDAAVIVGREQMPPIAAERLARAVYGGSTVRLNLGGAYVRQRRGYDLRLGQADAEVWVHPEPLVQKFVELKREQKLAQAIDRLRLIHPDGRKPEIYVLTNVPIPGIVVDRLVKLKEVWAGGTVWERALDATGGVVPLIAGWLTTHLPDIFGATRTTERAIAQLRQREKTASWQLEYYCELAVFLLAGGARNSLALVRADMDDPKSRLSEIMGKTVTAFWYIDDTAD